MKSNYAKNVGGRLLTLLAILLFALYSGTASAQSGNLILTQGNVNIYQNADGWVIYHGNAVIAHGEGTLDITDLPPAFQDFLDYYAALSLDKSPKKKLSKDAPTPVQYGPLLRTQWNQASPENDMCPIKDLGAGSYEQTLIGCVSITSGQLLNYYKYCNTITATGTNTYPHKYHELKDPFLTYVSDKDYSYNINYTPNFDLINNDNTELAKFLIAIAIVQKAQFDVSEKGGTGTVYKDQQDAMNDLYGYKADYFRLYEGTNSTNCQLSYGNYIKTAIEQGQPIIIRGQKNTDGSGGHSFMVDGFDGSMYHINYGWGGKGDGWFTEEATYQYDMGVIVSHPNNTNFMGMKASPASVHISGNGVNKTIEMVATGNGLEFRQKGDVELPAGEYEFYFEYSDETKIAPYSESTIALTKEYSRLGYFVSTPAKFSIAGKYKVNFLHIQDKGEIKLECADYNLAISGKVLDENSKGVAGVMISTSANEPQIEKDQYDENAKIIDGNYYTITLSEKSRWYRRTFVPTKKCLAQVDVKIAKTGTPESGLNVAILDNSLNILWQKHVSDADIAHHKWLTVPIDQCLAVIPGNKYYVGMMVDSYDENNCYKYEVTTDSDILYRVYGADDYFTRTDDNGNYSLSVAKNFEGNLYATDKNFLIEPLSVSKVTKPVENLNFTALTKTITVSGKVLDASSNGIANAYVTASTSIPVIDIDSHNELALNGTKFSGYYYSSVNTFYDITQFEPTKKYLTGLYVMGWYQGTPEGNLTIAIRDESKKIVWETTISHSQMVKCTSAASSDEDRYNKFTFDQVVTVEPGKTYYISWKNGSYSDDNCYLYTLNATNEEAVYRVYGTDDYFAKSTSTGAYQYEVERYSSFTLNAFTEDDKNFNTLTFSKLSANATNKDFKENGATVSYYGPLTVTEENGVKTAVIDGTSLETIEVENEIEVSSLKLERKFTAGVNTTIALPFNFNTSNFSGGTFHTLKRVYHNGTEWIAELSPAITGTILANTPYIYQPGTSSTEVTFTNVKIETTQELTVKPEGSDWELVTAYSKMEWNDKSKDYGYAASANDDRGIKVGDFVRAGKGAWMRPMRCYLHYAGTDNTFSKSTIDLPQSIIVVIAEEEQEEEPQIVEEEQPQDVDSVEDDFATPISEIVATNKINVWSYEKTIFIEATAGQHYTIIDANGRMLLNSETTSDREEVVLNTKTSGMLIVRIANKSFKLKY